MMSLGAYNISLGSYCMMSLGAYCTMSLGAYCMISLGAYWIMSPKFYLTPAVRLGLAILRNTRDVE